MSINHIKRHTRIRGEKGALLIAIAVLSLVMMIIAVGIVSLSSTQALSNQHQIERIKAEQVGKGVFWSNYMNIIHTGKALPKNPGAITLDNHSYIPTVVNQGKGINQTTAYRIDVAY